MIGAIEAVVIFVIIVAVIGWNIAPIMKFLERVSEFEFKKFFSKNKSSK